MRITFVLPVADLSGGIKVPAIHAQRLAQRGHQVEVVSVPRRVVRLREKVRSVLGGRGWPRAYPKASHLDGVGVPHKVIERYRPIEDRDVPEADVVVGTWWETLEWVAGLRGSKGAKVSFLQGFDAVFYEEHSPEKQARALQTWALPAHKIVVSRWLAELARERFGDTAVTQASNGVDGEQFWAPPRGRQALPTVGLQYATPRCKGMDVALRAVTEARRQIPSLRAVVFGKEKPVEPLPLPEWARFTYQPKQESIRELYAACDVWLCGSRVEGFLLPALEAMACRCPVVSTKTGWPMEGIEEGVNGHLVEVEDWRGLAAGVVRVLGLGEGAWRAMSEAAWATAQKHTWEDATTKFEAGLRRAVERSGRGELRRLEDRLERSPA